MDRRQDTEQYDRSGREPQRDEYGQREEYGQGQRAMTQERQRSGSDAERWSGSRGSGDWQGYVVPYRYYGPGYRGVGYYSVMYQGSGEEESRGQGRWGEDDRRQSMTGSQQGRGGYAGLGPKGYQRSDERLRDEVSDRLMEDDALDASGIEVEVRDGEVTLTGTVPERSMKRQAESCAERVMGVREVMNQIRVDSEGFGATGGQTGQTGQTDQSTSSRSSGSTSSTRSTQQHADNGQRDKATTSTR